MLFCVHDSRVPAKRVSAQSRDLGATPRAAGIQCCAARVLRWVNASRVYPTCVPLIADLGQARDRYLVPLAQVRSLHSSGTRAWCHQAARGRTSRSILPPLSRRALVRSCIACRFTQNSGLVPKKRASRNAVSAVTDRSPLTIAPMRVAGTRKAIASAFTDMPSGARNSSLSTSPGWVVTRLRVDDLDISAILRGPNETDAALRSESCTRQRLRVNRATPTPSPSPQGGGEHTEFAATALSGPRHAVARGGGGSPRLRRVTRINSRWCSSCAADARPCARPAPARSGSGCGRRWCP